MEKELIENISETINLNDISESLGTTAQVAEYQSNVKYFDEIENFLLGSFDKNGKYVIPDEISQELVKLKKIYLYAFGDNVFCESEYQFETIGKIQFMVKMQQTKKEMSAFLNIAQDLKRANGLLNKTAVTQISEYTAINSPSFVNDCFEKFNIHSKVDEGLQKKEFEQLDAQTTLARLKYLKDKQYKLDAQETVFKELVEKKLALLSKSKYGKKVVEQYKALVQREKNGKLMPGTKGYYRHLNSLLDKVVDEHKSILLADSLFVAQWGKVNANATTKIKNEVVRDVLQEEIKRQEELNPEKKETPKKEDKKEQSKEENKKPSFGKSSGGGGGNGKGKSNTFDASESFSNKKVDENAQEGLSPERMNFFEKFNNTILKEKSSKEYQNYQEKIREISKEYGQFIEGTNPIIDIEIPNLIKPNENSLNQNQQNNENKLEKEDEFILG